MQCAPVAPWEVPEGGDGSVPTTLHAELPAYFPLGRRRLMLLSFAPLKKRPGAFSGNSDLIFVLDKINSTNIVNTIMSNDCIRLNW